MLIQCPRGHTCQWSDRVCPVCDFKFTLGSILGHYAQQVMGGVRRRAVVSCPHCQAAAPITASTCPHCSETITFDAAYEATVEPTRQRYRNFILGASPRTKRLVRWSYFLLSTAGLWQMLAYVEAHVGDGWVWHAALSIVYLAVLLLGVLLFVKRERLSALVHHRSVSVKLGLIMNSFCLLILLQIFIGEWWLRSLVMAGLLLAVWVALYVLHEWVLPMLRATEAAFLGSPEKKFDHTGPQGRTARHD